MISIVSKAQTEQQREVIGESVYIGPSIRIEKAFRSGPSKHFDADEATHQVVTDEQLVERVPILHAEIRATVVVRTRWTFAPAHVAPHRIEKHVPFSTVKLSNATPKLDLALRKNGVEGIAGLHPFFIWVHIEVTGDDRSPMALASFLNSNLICNKPGDSSLIPRLPVELTWKMNPCEDQRLTPGNSDAA